MFSAAATRLFAVACFLSLSACGDKKEEAKSVETKDDAAIAVPQPPPPPDKVRSFLATGCEALGDAKEKNDCLCQVDVMDSMLDSELLAKLQTAPKDGPTSAVVEHVGGVENLARVYEAMRKASQECGQGATK